jgi:hypothetical protein
VFHGIDAGQKNGPGKSNIGTIRVNLTLKPAIRSALLIPKSIALAEFGSCADVAIKWTAELHERISERSRLKAQAAHPFASAEASLICVAG